MFCGCCQHTTPRVGNESRYFQCWHSKVNKVASRYGLTISETELEGMLYEILPKQAQVILNMADLSIVGMLDAQPAEQAGYDK